METAKLIGAALILLLAATTFAADQAPPFPQPRSDDGRYTNLAGDLERAGLDVTIHSSYGGSGRRSPAARESRPR